MESGKVGWAIGAGLAVLTAAVALMSGLPVFWPLIVLTVGMACCFGYAVLHTDFVLARSRPTKTLVCLGVAALVGVSMIKPLVAQYQRETAPPTTEPTKDPPLHITRVSLSSYKPGESVAVNVHYRATAPVRMTEGDASLAFIPLEPGSDWTSHRIRFEDDLWESFRRNSSALKNGPALLVPTDMENYFTVMGVTLSAKMIDQLRRGRAVLYYTAIVRYPGGAVEACGFVQSDKGPIFQCHDHNGPAPN
jgi:hypothetical protein